MDEARSKEIAEIGAEHLRKGDDVSTVKSMAVSSLRFVCGDCQLSEML